MEDDEPMEPFYYRVEGIDKTTGKSICGYVVVCEVLLALLTGLPPRKSADEYCERAKENQTPARINELRRERGITVDELRVYLGMNNPNSIYKWFRGEVLPTLENMYALSVILEVPIDDIIGRTA